MAINYFGALVLMISGFYCGLRDAGILLVRSRKRIIRTNRRSGLRGITVTSVAHQIILCHRSCEGKSGSVWCLNVRCCGW